MADWQAARLDGLTLAYREVGTGEPVVLVHAGVVADWFAPLLDAPALAGRYRLVSYHRANYGRSSRLDGPVSVADHAAHCAALLRYLGTERAHVVGHSAGASVAIQLALDVPDMVHTLAVLDPALSTPPPPAATTGPPATPPFIRQALDHYAAGDRAEAVDAFMGGVCGPRYRAKLEAALPGAFAQAVSDADGLFQQELPALRAWTVQPEELARIERPVLVVVGAESPPVFAERQRLLLDWLPRAEAFTLPGAGHLLQVEQPGPLAEALAGFFARHPL